MRTVSIDETTGIQPLERIAPALPMRPGQVERREFEYTRDGTQTLIACFDVATGMVEGRIGDTRTEQDFAGTADGDMFHVSIVTALAAKVARPPDLIG